MKKKRKKQQDTRVLTIVLMTAIIGLMNSIITLIITLTR